jgi:hypothetical protein
VKLIAKSSSFSIPCFMATNSAPKTEVSMVACFLETQSIKAILQKIRKPMRECLVLLSLLDIDKWLGVFRFTVKLVSKIMRAF